MNGTVTCKWDVTWMQRGGGRREAARVAEAPGGDSDKHLECRALHAVKVRSRPQRWR